MQVTDQTGILVKEVKQSPTAEEAASIPVKSKLITNKDDVVTVVENIAKDQLTEEALLLFARPGNNSKPTGKLIRLPKTY